MQTALTILAITIITINIVIFILAIKYRGKAIELYTAVFADDGSPFYENHWTGHEAIKRVGMYKTLIRTATRASEIPSLLKETREIKDFTLDLMLRLKKQEEINNLLLERLNLAYVEHEPITKIGRLEEKTSPINPTRSY
jgi:hypothetical protein